MKEIKKKRGRPLKDGARKKRIFSKCNDEEYSFIERAARINNMSVSEFIRISAYNASVDSINKREKALKDMYGGGTDDEYYDEYTYEEDMDDEEYI